MKPIHNSEPRLPVLYLHACLSYISHLKHSHSSTPVYHTSSNNHHFRQTKEARAADTSRLQGTRISFIILAYSRLRSSLDLHPPGSRSSAPLTSSPGRVFRPYLVATASTNTLGHISRPLSPLAPARCSRAARFPIISCLAAAASAGFETTPLVHFDPLDLGCLSSSH